jgi:DNA-binding NarL/FixJ family response regulator
MAEFTLMIADDHEIVRKGLRAMLETDHRCEVIGECADGREAVAMAHMLEPDVVVIDISMPLLNGLEATRQILKTRPETKVLVITMHESDRIIREALEAGARGLVLKTDAARDLVTAVNLLQQGKMYFTPRMAQLMLDGFRSDTPGPERYRGTINRLTPREREIVQLVAEGKSSKEVSVALGVSVKTVESHRANLMRKLGCHSVTALVRYAVRNQLIDP